MGKSSNSRSAFIARLKRVMQVPRRPASAAPYPSREASGDDADADDAPGSDSEPCADQVQTQAYNANQLSDDWGAPAKFYT